MSGRFAFALLLVVCTLCFFASHVLADERTVLMNVGGSPPPSLGKAGINILHGLPRYGGAPNTLGIVDPNDSERFDENKKYALGVALPFGIALGLGLLTWWTCWGFCCARACCNSCGGRTASRAYTTKDQLWLKIGTIILGAASITLFFIGVVSNAAVSASIDQAYLHSDALVEHLYQFNSPIKDMSVISTNALQQVQNLNSSVLAQLPDQPTRNDWSACAALMYQVVQAELQLLVQTAPITGSTTTDPSVTPASYNLPSLAQQMQSVQASAKAFPDLSGQAALAAAHNKSLSNILPSPATTGAINPARSVAQGQALFKSAGPTLAANLSNQLNPSLTAAQPSIQPFRTLLGQYESSATTFPLKDQLLLYQHINTNNASAVTVGEITNFNTSLAQLPNTAAFLTALNNFQTAFGDMRGISLSIATTLAAYQSNMAGLVALPGFDSLLAKLRASVPYPTNTAALESSFRSTDPTLATFTQQVSSFSMNLQASMSGIDDLRRVQTNISANGASTVITINGTTIITNPNLHQSLQIVNRTLPQVVCIKPVLSQLKLLNDTVLVLPQRISDLLSRRQQILIQLSRLSRVQYDLQQSFNNLGAISTVLGTFPNMTTISNAMVGLNTALGLFPNLTLAANAVKQLSTDLSTITDAQLLSLQLGFQGLNQSVIQAQSDINTFANALSSLRTTILSIPQTGFTTQIIYANSIAQAVSTIRSDLDSVVSQSRQPGFTASGGIQDPLKSSFLSKLQSYTQIFQSGPSTARTALLSSLGSLLTNIPSVLSTQSNIPTRISQLQTAGNNYPDAQPVWTLVQEITSMTQQGGTFSTLFSGQAYRVLNASISTLPNMTTSATQITTFSNTLSNSPGSSSLKQLESDLTTAQNFMQALDLVVLDETLDAMSSLENGFPDLDTPLGSLGVASSGLTNAQEKLTNYREYKIATYD
jgi:hypothetical protein